MAKRTVVSEEMAVQEVDKLVLAIEDLLPDTQGEVVLFADALPVDLIAHDVVAAQGVAAPHVTASGIDVTGLNYLSFMSGLTVYYSPDLPLTVTIDA
jgi:hypothetical protein